MKELIETLSADKWDRIGRHRRSGVLVPLFSVYSKNSVGIGGLNDIKLLVDWCENTDNSILQLLPMNEVGSTFCPYDAISSFALEPMYISLESLDADKKGSIGFEIDDARKAFHGMQKKGRINYDMKAVKDKILRNIYLKEDDTHSEDFKKFEDDSGYWLEDFTLFKTLKAHLGGKPWYEWPDKYKGRDPKALRDFAKKHASELGYHKWAQWTAYKQFMLAKAHAGSKGIKICGDLPILISRDSADVWAHADYFKLDFAAGAPPDMYCAKGQRWGMPTYDWEKIASDGYKYFSQKLKYAENFYDILRVDHVVGLFRIWSIPYNDPPENEGLNGSFDPSDESTWKDHGRQILSMMLKNTKMLLLAEDLGMIPKQCPETLKEFGIPGNDVQRWTKDWVSAHDFLDPKDYRLLSVAMLSTHDTTNWAAWWENEAGTVDEALFMSKALDRGIDYGMAKERLFDPALSRHGRLRWLKDISSVDILVECLGKDRQEIKDFIDMYENTYQEKEKLWKRMKMSGAMREKCDADIVISGLRITQSSNAIFCVELLIDYLYSADIFKGDPYKYRINRPGTVSKENWSLVIPMSLEELLKHDVTKNIRKMISSCGRI